MDESPQPKPLAGDRPINAAEQDALGRAGFALQIEHELTASLRDDGLVVAVTGAWGSGKTSLINLALAPLETRAGYRVVRFNPWLFSGTPQLVEHFFAELRAQFEGSGSQHLKHVGEALSRYGSLIDPLRFLPGVGKVADATKFAGGLLTADGKPVSAREQRDELNKLLAEHDELLIIVLDDSDRLRDEEVVDVMRLVRLVADFPNTAYVLAFDIDRVARAVSPHDERAGHAYIEKIVQVAHEVPSVSDEQLSDLLLERLGHATEGITYRLDQQHWSRLFLTFRRYIRTLRDVSRYCNHIRAPLMLLADEIEASDVLALEALRLFERALWAKLPLVVNELTSTAEGPSILSDVPAPEGDRLKEMVADARLPDTARELMMELFPASARWLGGSRVGSGMVSAWERKRRAAHADVLRIYLTKQIQPMEVPTSLVEDVIESLGDGNALRQKINALNPPQLRSLMSRLENHEEDFPGRVAPAVPVIYELGRKLPPPERMFDYDPRTRVARVVLRLLRNREEPWIVETVEEALGGLTNLSDRWALVRLVGHREGSGHRLVAVGRAEAWEQQLVEQLLSASSDELACGTRAWPAGQPRSCPSGRRDPRKIS